MINYNKSPTSNDIHLALLDLYAYLKLDKIGTVRFYFFILLNSLIQIKIKNKKLKKIRMIFF